MWHNKHYGHMIDSETVRESQFVKLHVADISGTQAVSLRVDCTHMCLCQTYSCDNCHLVTRENSV